VIEADAFVALLRQGLNSPDLSDLLIRGSIGTFFAISGGNKLFVPTRHASLRRSLAVNNIPCVEPMAWWVAGWEFLAGAMLAVGLLSAFSAGVLLIICLVACWCEAHQKVESYKPINGFDRVADYLYLPEVLYIVLLTAAILHGTGAFSLDRLLWGAP
jgi:putative oxidoreductase